MCKFRLGASRQRRGEDNVWYSVDQVWLNVECWGPLAQHARRSLTKGMAVIVVGTLVTHSWRDADGELQSYMVVKASHIGPDLNRYLTNTVVPQHAWCRPMPQRRCPTPRRMRVNGWIPPPINRRMSIKNSRR